MENQIMKKTEVKPLTVFDSEKGDFVEVTPEMQRHAAYVHSQVQMGSFIIALAIKKIFDEKLYLGLGCSSKKEYCSTMLSFGQRQAERYIFILRKFQKFLPEIDEGRTENSTNATLKSHFENIGITKLYELTKLEDADFEELMESGELHTEQGDLSLENIKDMAYRDAMVEISKIRKKSEKMISNLQEKVKTLKSEQVEYQRKSDIGEENIGKAREIERQYGPAARAYEEKLANIKLAKDYLNKAQAIIAKIGVSADDPETVQMDLLEIYGKMSHMRDLFHGLYGEVMITMEYQPKTMDEISVALKGHAYTPKN